MRRPSPNIGMRKINKINIKEQAHRLHHHHKCVREECIEFKADKMAKDKLEE